ncbi:MAG: rRNA pseudouridine synthase [Nitrospirae bacterium]|nr:rRNA pseudouridine synthase [Candidatus Troglogloeales bacterium]
MERLQKIIAMAGIASRRHAEELILDGRVRVNGAVITELGSKADPLQDHIKVNGKHLAAPSKNLYLILNKPKGYITSVSDPEGRPTVMQLISGIKERLYPVGRLDYYTEGLLLLTNDGGLAHKLMHPRYGIEKRYLAKVKGMPSEGEIKQLASGGVPVSGGVSAPCQIRAVRKTTQNAWFELILHEGKKREVRVLMDNIGHQVLKLKRVGYAHLKLGTLPPGAYRHLTEREVEGLTKRVLLAEQNKTVS